ncbi:hypothetical protein Tco_0571548 [Tanacetum coccineum]
MFIKSRIYLDDEYVDMTCNKFLQYTRLEIPNSRDTLIQHMESVKKSIDERAKHKEEYDSWKALGTNPKTGYKQQIKNDAYPMMQISQTHDDEEPMVERKLRKRHKKAVVNQLQVDAFLLVTNSQAVNKSPTHYPCDSARTFRVILFSIHNDEWKSFQCHHQTALRSYALSWKPCQGDSLNLPDHRIHKDGDGDASFQLKSDSLPHAHAQTTKTYYKHQDSRIMKAQELKTKTSAQTLIYKIFLQRYQVYQGRLLASFQDDAKYEHVGQDTRSQGGKDDQDGRIKI